MIFDELLFNNLLEQYYRLVDQNPYSTSAWRTNGAPAEECRQILHQMSRLIEVLLREYRLLDEPFSVRISDGAGNFPRQPWIGIFRQGGNPRTGVYPLMGFCGYDDYVYVACVKGKRCRIADWDGHFRDLSRYQGKIVQDEIAALPLYDDPNVAFPATVFRRHGRVSKSDLVAAWKKAVKVCNEVHAHEVSSLGQALPSKVDDRRVGDVLASTDEKLELLKAALKEIESRQEQVQVKNQLGLENVEKVRMELATLRQAIEDTRTDAENVGRAATKKVDEVVGKAKENAASVISAYLSSQEAKCLDIERKFRSILERATIASISDEFEKKRTLEESKYIVMRRWFYGLLALFAALGLGMVCWNHSEVSGFAVDNASPLVYLKNLPHIAMFFTPVYLPLIWVVCRVNKLMNQAHRLMEEYSHKVVVSKTYLGLAKQTEDLIKKGVDSAKETNAKLLQDTIAVLCRNPNGVLDRVRTEMPLTEAVDLVAKVASSSKK